MEVDGRVHRTAQNLAIYTFRAWMRETHPGVQLTDLQRHWIDCCLAGGQALFVGAHGEDRGWVTEMWREFLLAQHPDGSYIYTPPIHEDGLDLREELKRDG